MSRKTFHIGIDLDIHAVSCPGVWLCPKGDAMLKISMLGASAHTKRLEPTFPMLFHESFHFRKTFTGVTSLAGLQTELAKRLVHIQLVQWQVHGCRCVLLAAFHSPLTDLLYPQPTARQLVAGVDIDLLMETTPCFPGIIAPKVEVSTKVIVEEMVNYPVHCHDVALVTHKTLSSKQAYVKKENKMEVKSKNKQGMSSSCQSRVRQKPVCHTRPAVKCYYCKQRVSRGSGRAKSRGETLLIPYCNKCGDAVEDKELKHGQVIVKEGPQNIGKGEPSCLCAEPSQSKSACDCNLCRKYYKLFKTCTSDSSALSSKWKHDQPPSPYNKEKHKLTPCTEAKAAEITWLRGKTTCPKMDCPCMHVSSWDSSQCSEKDDVNKEVSRNNSKYEDYKNIFKTELDEHYRKLYERVSRRSNRRES